MTPEQQHVASLFQTVGPILYRRCLKLLGDADCAQDATQEVFLTVLRRPEQLDDVEKALPFLYRAATNHCLNVRRHLALRAHKDVVLCVSEAVPAETFPSRQLAQAVLSRFDPKTQAIAVGVLVDEMEQSELAQTLGISAKTVSRKLERFLGNARKYLTRSAS